MLFNKRVRIGYVRIHGTTRVFKGKYEQEGETGYEFGINIIPKRLGFLLYMWVTDVQKVLEEKLRKKEEHINNLKEIMRLVF